MVEADRVRKERDKQERTARRKARVLLLKHLNREQRKAYREKGCFRVIAGGGQVYEIAVKQGQAGNVFRMEGGKRVEKLCCHPRSVAVPDDDAFLAQKLWLEADEAEFVKTANRTALAA